MAAADSLARRSVEVLKAGQAPSGAFVAAPSFPTYGYAWLRDGAFCAHALELAGEREAAAGFHRWVVRTLTEHRWLLESAAAGETPPLESMPPARFTLAGGVERAEGEPWPRFQPDGYGTWLWALERHLGPRRPDGGTAAAVALVERYLAATWRLPCFDCWEEWGGGEHASTLGAVLAGLEAAARLLDEPAAAEEAAAVRERLLSRFLADGRFRRGAADDRVDGSLLWLAVPFGVLPPDDPRIRATVAAIRRDLAGPGGGLYRYLGDTYYGGGQWLLLTSSLAWHDAVVGDRNGFDAADTWVRAQARPAGDLPEQVTDHAQEPALVDPWTRRWGPVATPLLWSHAMLLIAGEAAR